MVNVYSQENFLSEIKNEGDSSDEEGNGENAEEESDLESEFSFESFDGEEGSGEESAEEDSSLGFEDDSDNYAESDEIAEEQESGNEESESESEAIPEAELARKTMKNDKRKMIKAEKKQQKVEKKKSLEILLEQRKGERAVQKDFSKSVKDALRMPDDGFLERRERPGPSRAITEESTDDVSVEKPKKVDEYEDGVTSDEEDIRNTVGNIPMHWYDEYKHIGYDWDGNKIIKPQKRDQLDDFLKKMEDPNFWRTVKDPQTGQEVILSDDDIQLIKKIMKQRNPDQSFDEYAPWIEWFTNEVEQLPIRNIPDSKTSFLPSKNEKLKVGKLVHSLKMGWMKTKAEQDKINAMNKQPKFFMLWESDTGREKMRRIHDHVAAPKRALPGHAESYNPPPEYLFNDDEMRQWEKMNDTPYKRKLHFIPQKFKSLRQVPYYDRYIRERFLRCLDLYLCPRAKRMKVTVQAEDLIPKLPSPRDLQPFPTMENMVYRGHKGLIRTVSIEPKGQYIVTGSDDKTVKIWEVATGRCIKTIDTQDIVRSVSWCPNPKLSLIAVATGKRLLLVNPYVGDIKLISKKTDDLLAEAPTSDQVENERIKTAVQWNNSVDEAERKDGIRVIINHFQEIKQVVWHGRGDYFATVMPTGMNRSVLIHQLSKRRSQIPFSKSKGLVQCVLFHPIKPCLFVAVSLIRYFVRNMIINVFFLYFRHNNIFVFMI